MQRVSICLPVYNGENYITEAIESILAQTYEDFDLIITDNASFDRTREICSEYSLKDRRIKYYRNQKNLGATNNYNIAYHLSSGEYIKWAAHDDFIMPTYLEKCVAALDANPDVVLSFPGTSYINQNNIILGSSNGDLSLKAEKPADRLRQFVNYQKKSRDIFWAIFGLIRRKAIDSTGLFGNYVASDQALLMKLALVGQFHQIPEKLYYRRVHKNASTVLLPNLPYKERAKWYDTTGKSRYVLPNWQLFLDDLKAVSSIGHIETVSRAKCIYMVTKMFVHRWKRLIKELASLPSQIKRGIHENQ